MRIFQQNIFSVKRSISPTTGIFFSFLNTRMAFLVMRDITPGWLESCLSVEIITGYEEDKG